MSPKYRSTIRRTCGGLMSPPMTSVALFGAYQVRKKLRTSSMVAAARSAMDPITGQL